MVRQGVTRVRHGVPQRADGDGATGGVCHPLRGEVGDVIPDIGRGPTPCPGVLGQGAGVGRPPCARLSSPGSSRCVRGGRWWAGRSWPAGSGACARVGTDALVVELGGCWQLLGGARACAMACPGVLSPAGADANDRMRPLMPRRVAWWAWWRRSRSSIGAARASRGRAGATPPPPTPGGVPREAGARGRYGFPPPPGARPPADFPVRVDRSA
jgi:hypothetical protein